MTEGERAEGAWLAAREPLPVWDLAARFGGAPEARRYLAGLLALAEDLLPPWYRLAAAGVGAWAEGRAGAPAPLPGEPPAAPVWWTPAGQTALAVAWAVQWGPALGPRTDGDPARLGFEPAAAVARARASAAAGPAAAVVGADPVWHQAWQAAWTAARAGQAGLMRCVYGNPFRPVVLDPRWRTADAVGLARAIYEDRAFDRLPLLADALMDAGCEDEQVIGHCRSAGPHARGCWVVDRVLGTG